ncbi:hypothetical protein [Bradyrhizobium sp. 2TAF24]|uniref:hypothetical protein n=1 Tax=Bradyrhizobium sp. 2TAF24 TaxID=3233011 RepID=UPI003F92BCCB
MTASETTACTPDLAPVHRRAAQRPDLAMASQPSPFMHNSNVSMPQKLLRLTGSYNPAPPPASWRRAQRHPDAA